MGRSIEGLYLHCGWDMNYPFSPRTWSEAEWYSWLDLFKGSSIAKIFVWPGFEFIRPDVSKIEQEYLGRIQSMIKHAQRLGFEVILGMSANAILKDEVKLEFTNCNQSHLECLNPLSAEFINRIILPLKKKLSFVGDFDGWWIIDRDPGDSFGTDADVFVDIMEKVSDILPHSVKKYYYWMWGGWTNEFGQKSNWRNEEQEYWSKTVAAFKRSRLAQHMQFLCCWPGHLKSLRKITTEKAYYFPYNYLEPEPSLPYYERKVECLQQYLWQEAPDLDIILNIQTPCLRTPSLMSRLKGEELRDFTLNDVEKYWVWSDSSLQRLNKEMVKLDQELQVNSEAAIERWKNYTGFSAKPRRGYLYENF